MSTVTFAISYARAMGPLLSLLGTGPRASAVVVSPDSIDVRMGWAFTAHIPTGTIQVAEPDTAPILGWGVHGWRGRWLVNGSAHGLVRLRIEPVAQARVLGFPVRLSVLRLSLVDPDGFLAAVQTAIEPRRP